MSLLPPAKQFHPKQIIQAADYLKLFEELLKWNSIPLSTLISAMD